MVMKLTQTQTKHAVTALVFLLDMDSLAKAKSAPQETKSKVPTTNKGQRINSATVSAFTPS